jgi:hypothetical protein
MFFPLPRLLMGDPVISRKTIKALVHGRISEHLLIFCPQESDKHPEQTTASYKRQQQEDYPTRHRGRVCNEPEGNKPANCAGKAKRKSARYNECGANERCAYGAQQGKTNPTPSSTPTVRGLSASLNTNGSEQNH